MAERRKPVVLSTRATKAEAAVVRAAAEAAGKSVNAWALSILLEAASAALRERWGAEAPRIASELEAGPA